MPSKQSFRQTSLRDGLRTTGFSRQVCESSASPSLLGSSPRRALAGAPIHPAAVTRVLFASQRHFPNTSGSGGAGPGLAGTSLLRSAAISLVGQLRCWQEEQRGVGTGTLWSCSPHANPSPAAPKPLQRCRMADEQPGVFLGRCFASKPQSLVIAQLCCVLLHATAERVSSALLRQDLVTHICCSRHLPHTTKEALVNMRTGASAFFLVGYKRCLETEGKLRHGWGRKVTPTQ